jgi:Domain of unknown function (DUF4331)
MLTVDGKVHPAGDKNAVIGTYGATSRRRLTVRRKSGKLDTDGQWIQVNREGNSLINELIIGTGFKDRFSVDDPENDKQFASFFLDPLLAHLFSSVLHIPIPPAPRVDLLPLVQDAARKMQDRSPICCG